MLDAAGRGHAGRHDPAQRRAQADRGMHDRGERRRRRSSCSAPQFRRCTASTTSRRKRSTRTCSSSCKEFKLRMPPWAKVQPRDFRAAARRRSATGPMPRCWNRCVLRSQSWRCTRRTTSATSAWRSRPTRTSPRRSGAIPTCSCIARSSTRCRAARRLVPVFAARDGGAVRCIAPSASAAPTRPSARSTSATEPRGWRSTSAASSTAPSAASPASACSSSWTIPRSTAWCTSRSCRTTITISIRSARRSTGERRGREFRLGDRVEIVVLKASVEDRQDRLPAGRGSAGVAEAAATAAAWTAGASARKRSTKRPGHGCKRSLASSTLARFSAQNARMSKDSQWIAGINAVAAAIAHDADNVREVLLEAGAQNPRIGEIESQRAPRRASTCAASRSRRSRASPAACVTRARSPAMRPRRPGTKVNCPGWSRPRGPRADADARRRAGPAQPRCLPAQCSGGARHRGRHPERQGRAGQCHGAQDIGRCGGQHPRDPGDQPRALHARPAAAGRLDLWAGRRSDGIALRDRPARQRRTGAGWRGRRHAAIDARALRPVGEDPDARRHREPQRFGRHRRHAVRSRAAAAGLTDDPIRLVRLGRVRRDADGARRVLPAAGRTPVRHQHRLSVVEPAGRRRRAGVAAGRFQSSGIRAGADMGPDQCVRNRAIAAQRQVEPGVVLTK